MLTRMCLTPPRLNLGRVPRGPQAESDIDLRDKQLDELSRSILAPVLVGVPPVGTEFPADNVSVDVVDVDYSANGISNGNNHVAHVHNVDNTVVDNDVNNNVVNNNMVGSNAVNNNLAVNESTVNNNVENNGSNVMEISTSENSAIANNNSMEEPNYSPVSDSENIVDPGSSSLCAYLLDSGNGNLVETSSSALISSGASVVVI